MMKDWYLFILFLLAALAMSLCYNVRLHHKVQRGLTYTDTLTYIYWDTIPVPVPRDSIVLRYVTATLPVASDTNVASKNDTSAVRNFRTTTSDSATVQLPITQKLYSTPDFRAYVSGYAPTLDSLFFRKQKEVVTIREKPKRWGVGLQAGYGIPHGAYIGVGISYNLWRW